MAFLALVAGKRDSWKYVRDRSTRIQASEGIKGLPNQRRTMSMDTVPGP